MSTELNLETERAAFEATYIAYQQSCRLEPMSDEEKEVYIARSTFDDDKYKLCQSEWNGWLMARRASPAAAVPEGALTPLKQSAEYARVKEEFRLATTMGARFCIDSAMMTVETLAAYAARAAVEADRAQQHQSGHMPPFAAPAGQLDEEIVGAVARGWSAPENSHKAMDTDLALAITREVYAVFAPRCRAEGGDGAPEAGDVSADRAQQGELVGEFYDKAYICKGCGGVYVGQPVSKCDCMPVVQEFDEGAIYRAATKAAAPADAPKLPQYGYVNFETLDYVVGFGGDRIPDGYYPITIAAPVPERALAQPGLPTAGEVEKAGFGVPDGYVLLPEVPTDKMVCAIEAAIDSQLVASAMSPAQMFRQDGERIYEALLEVAAPSHPSEAKAGEPCAHCNRLPGDPEYCDWIECPGGAAPAHPGEGEAP